MCTDGRRPGAPEDCGGVHGYELIAAVSEPADSDSDALVGDWIVVDGRRYFVAGYTPGGAPYGCFEDKST